MPHGIVLTSVPFCNRDAKNPDITYFIDCMVQQKS